MAEQTFKSAGFFEREIDLSQRDTEIVGVPAGVAGTAQMGPAFVPVTVGSFSDFENRFGTLDPNMFGPYAVREFFKNQTALTYVRVLGAGANTSITDFNNTKYSGIVKAAGFRVIGAKLTPGGRAAHILGRKSGAVQFIAGAHFVSASSEATGSRLYTDNDSFNLGPAHDAGGHPDSRTAYLIRAVLFTSTGSRFEMLNGNSGSYAPTSAAANDFGSVDASGRFKLVLSSTAGSAFARTDGYDGIKIFTASLDPTDTAYIGNILNTDPAQFQIEQHLLYADFPVESELAKVIDDNRLATVAILSGSERISSEAGISSLSFSDAFGRFDTRYKAPSTTKFISQPFGKKEFDLFHFEAISDGAVSNEKYKISITSLKKSTVSGDPYGTFTVQVRSFDDNDKGGNGLQVLEQYSECNLNPTSENYVALKIGDYKAFYNFDAELDSEKKVRVSGKYGNQSRRIRIVMSKQVETREVPDSALPFGFRGFAALKTNDTLTDSSTGSLPGNPGSPINGGASGPARVVGVGAGAGMLATSLYNLSAQRLTGSIVPPIPFRFKCTDGNVNTTPTYIGQPGSNESANASWYWGTKFDRVGLVADGASVLGSNGSDLNNLFKSYAKMLSISKLGTAVTGSGADAFNNNKFTLARVALSNGVANNSSGDPDLDTTANTVITGTAKDHMVEAAYIRNGKVDPAVYSVYDGTAGRSRVTMASLLAMTSSAYFNRFSSFAKFTNFLYGGFDGVNILDSDMAKMNDKASSTDPGGLNKASLDIGLSTTNMFGTQDTNNTVAAYRAAGRILTEPATSRVNIIAIPGIRDALLTDFVQSRLGAYGKAFYISEIPSYDSTGRRLFDGDSDAPNVTKTAEKFGSRAVNNNFSSVYFPDVTIEDPINNMPVPVPATVAVMGALSYNDSIMYPWFAPAGFNRASLDFVVNTKVRLNQSDRDGLYEARINPIASFPSQGFVIWGQKTLQNKKSALDRVNVRRMLLEVKRQIAEVAVKIVFEANTPSTRARFVSQIVPKLAAIQSQQGIDQFKVVCDSSNNTDTDIENNILNGRIVMVPTRAVEFIAIDFIITHAGVSFE